jgi:ketosteroid isomerase-like protein
MKKLIGLSAIVLVLILAFSVQAQEWTPEQKDVWAGVEKYWEVNQSNPMDFLNYFDASYFGWNYDNEAPSTKKDVTKSFGYWTKKGKEQYHILKPARIWVNGSFAYVHYYYTTVSENSAGKPNTDRGRWTDILMKKDGKWMLVGDHGGEVKK